MSLDVGTTSGYGEGDVSHLEEEFSKYKLEIETLRKENEELHKDKSLLEEIIDEKDKLINNLQLQIDNLLNFSTSFKTPVTAEPVILDPPPRSAQRLLRSVSSPISLSGPSSDLEPVVSQVVDHEDDTFRTEDTSVVPNSAADEITITEDFTQPVLDTVELGPEPETQIPERNPDHRIASLQYEDASPAKSNVSSNYSPIKDEEESGHSDLSNSITNTPVSSPSRPSAQQAQYMGISVSEMVWGSTPPRAKSPIKGKKMPLSPLKNQLFSDNHSFVGSTSVTPEDEDEFNFTPMSGFNNSTTSLGRRDIPKSPVNFKASRAESPEVPTSQPYLNVNNDLDSVVRYMDKRLGTKGQLRSRASTASSVLGSKDANRSQQGDPFNAQHEAAKRIPSDSQIPRNDNKPAELNLFESTSLNSRSTDLRSTRLQVPPQSPAPPFTPATPNTINSARFTNFDEEELAGLMVRPEDLGTTLVAVVSVIDGTNSIGKKKPDDPAITLGCFLVESSGEKREIFKFTKTYSQLLEFDLMVRPHFFELLPLPEISSFLKTTPNTVQFRRQILNNYFYKLYELKIKPKDLSLAICRFVSTDPVFKFDFNEHIVKEGHMLRKGTGKLNSTWKVVYCAVYGSTLEITDIASAKKQTLNILDCKLGNEEDTKDSKHAISVTEPRKNVLSSSNNKIVLCAESYEEKSEWLELLAKGSSNFKNPTIKSSSESMLSGSSNYDSSTEVGTLRYNNSFSSSINNPKLSSPSVSEAPDTPRSQSTMYDDVTTLNSVSKPKKRGGLFGIMRDKSAKSASPEKPMDNTNSSDMIGAVTNLESYQLQQQLQPQETTIDSSYAFSPHTPTAAFSNDPELFGSSLQTAIELSSSEYKGKVIPSICFRCIDYLEKKNAIYSEGIFRLTGKSSEINLLNELFNRKYDVDFKELEREPDIDSISTLLKRYLRSLKESVITPELVDALKLLPSGVDQKPVYYKEKVATVLPKINFDLLFILLQYLIKVIKHKEYNKMDINNITMLFSVNFNVDENILSELIIDFDYIFQNAASPVPLDKRPHLRR